MGTTQVNPPGPGNDNYNSFDITRSYINFFYSPNDKYTLRVTPNIFRFVGNVPNQKIGKDGAVGATPNGSLTVRIKYAYVDFNKLFANSPSFSSDKLTIGQQTNPLIDWEEALYGYRFTSLVPWNYLSLSSTHAGVKLHGPIKVNGKQYLDYEVGAFDSGNINAMIQVIKQSSKPIPFVIDIGSADQLTQQGVKYVFRVFTTNSTMGRRGIEYLMEIFKDAGVPSKRAVLLHTSDLFGQVGAELDSM